jgi:CDP-diacylglycerol--glycerol-3-phosphate 3-phosphatidyltransferase
MQLISSAPAPGRRHAKLIPLPVETAFLSLSRPFVRLLVAAGVRPNTITTAGTALVLASAWAFATGQIRLGGFLLLLSGGVDTLDGAVARATQQVTKFGAFYDSMLDRVGDGATFMGIALYLLTTADPVAFRNLAIGLCMVAIVASLTVSYARARADGLGLECTVGIAQRAERIVGLGGASLLVGGGPRGLVLEGVVAALALASVITVAQRLAFVYRTTEGGRGRTSSP